ncbi:MAG: tetratricopeptide repeat protein [bacterium]
MTPGPDFTEQTAIVDKAAQLLRRGEAYFALGRSQQAGEVFELILQTDPNHKEALNNLGVMAHQAGQYDQARAYFSRALKVDPHFEECLANMRILPDSDNKSSETTAAENQPVEQSATAIDFNQQLPPVGYVDDRKRFTVDFCRGKKVLHIGCVDAGMTAQRRSEKYFLHDLIAEAATELIGVDIDNAGLELLRDSGHEVYRLNIETDCDLLAQLAARVDVIVMPEVIEHLNNPGLALDNLVASAFSGDIFITTPNAFSYRANQTIATGVELVHPDHNYWFSPTTLKTLLGKHGLEVRRMLMYYYRGGDEIGRKFDQIMKDHAHYGDGIMVIARASSQLFLG